MKTNDDVDLNKLFNIDVQYKVPIYQRRYVWDESNWKALWKDILARLDLEPIEEKDPKDPESLVRRCEQSTENVSRVIYQDTHFTGVIVTDPIPKSESLERFEVIDGQQRLTTFQIIFCVIRDIFESNNCRAQADDANALIKNKPAVSQRFSDATYKFVLTEYDKKEFEKVAGGDYGLVIPDAFNEKTNFLDDDKLRHVRSAVFLNPDDLSVNVLKAYNYFYEWLRIYMKGNFDYKKLDNLLNTIKIQFTVVKIQLDPTDKSEKIFESINATGRKLSEFDYLRNNFFLRSKSLGQNAKRKRSYRDILYKDYWDFENNHSYWTPEKLQEFLRTFLIAKLGPKCFESTQADGNGKKDKKAFEVYQDPYIKNIKKDVIKLKDQDIKRELGKLDESDKEIKRKFIELNHEIRELKRYSEDYKAANPDDKSPDDKFNDYPEIGIRMQFYRDLRIQSFLPFVLHLKNEKEIPPNELEQVFQILESCIVRRRISFVLGIEDKAIYGRISDFFYNLVEGPFWRKYFLKNFLECLPYEDTTDVSYELRGFPICKRFYVDTENPTNIRGSDSHLQEIMNQMSELIKIKEICDLSSFLPSHQDMLVLSYIFYRIEKHIDRDNKEKLHFRDFLFYEPERILKPKHIIIDDSNLDIYNKIGNFTFLEEDKPFNNSNLKLNQELVKELYKMGIETKNNDSNLTVSPQQAMTLINKRTKILHGHFCKIWPDPKLVLEQISERG